MSAEFVDVKWYCSGHGNVGIVKVKDPYDGVKYYIGQVEGLDEQADIDKIMNLGSSFPKDAGAVLFGDL
jgi:hypothetical protein